MAASKWRNIQLTRGKVLLFVAVGLCVAVHLSKTIAFRIQRYHQKRDEENSERMDSFLKRMVIVTAISDNHFIEAQDMINSVHDCLPHNDIILYDLGLSYNNKMKIKQQYKYIEIRQFPFDDYTHLPHVRDLLTYAWKPILIKEVSLEDDAIMYVDASVRMISCDIEKALKHFFDFPFIARPIHNRKIVEVSHDGMIEYLKYPKSRKDIENVGLVQATGWVLWANPTMKKKLIEPWYDCAIHQECIAPEGAQLGPCHFTNTHDGHYIGCHRYDQAALNLILAREFGTTAAVKAGDLSSFHAIWNFKKLHVKKTPQKP